MGLPLLLPLLLLPVFLRDGTSTKCNSKPDYQINQPEHLSAPEGGSIHIPFSFCHPWESADVLSMRITWRWKNFHGEFIYNTTPHFIHEDFKNRLFLNWTEGRGNGYLQISNLQLKDNCTYFCQVRMTPREHEELVWQSIPGTKLTVTPATKKTTQDPTSITTTITTDGLSGQSVPSGGKRTSGSWSLSMEAVVSMALFSAMLKIAILGVTVYLRWKRSKGLQTKARAPARGSFQNTEEKYENTGNEG